MSFGYQMLGFGAFPNRATGYQVTRALIFDGSADELTFTPSQDGTGAGKKYTLSFWTKIIDPDSTGSFFSAGQSGGDSLHIQTDWSSGNPFLNFNDSSGGSSNWLRRTHTRVLRDSTAWMHILFAVDNSSGGGLAGTAAAARVYINGVEDTTFATASTHPASSETSRMTMQYEHVIGNGAGFSDYKAFYLAEFIIVDGQQLAPTDLGEFSNGVWVPKNPAGITFGNNGCHLDFKSAADIGNDVSGNNNDFTAVSMGVNNVVSDTCTDGVEEEVTFFSCLDEDNKESSLVLSSNNLKAENDSASNWQSVLGNIGLTSGRFYYEITRAYSGHGYDTWGVAGDGKVAGDFNRGSAGAITFDTTSSSIRKYVESTSAGTYYSSGTGSASGNVIGVDIDVDNDTIELIVGGTGRGTLDISGLAKPFFPISMIYTGGSVDHVYNFGASSYTHTKPTGASNITKTATGVGNYATWNPNAAIATTLTQGNTKYARSGYPSSVMCTHFAHTSGKYFCEARFTRADTVFLGVKPINAQVVGNASVSSPWNEHQNLYFAYLSNDALGGNIVSPETASAISDQSSPSKYSVASGDTVGCLLNLDDYNVRWYKLTDGAWVQIGNNAANATVPLYPTGQSWTFVARGTSSGDAIDANFGQRPFSATPPDSAVPLSTHTLATVAVTDPSVYFQNVLYDGTGSTQSISGVGFQPDFVWTKRRNVSGTNHMIFDSVRGATKFIGSDRTTAETTVADTLTSFDSDGFTLGADAGGYGTNVSTSSSKYLAYCWKAGDSNTAVSESGSGSGAINACTHRASTTSGLSIIKYTGLNDEISNGEHTLVTHGLGSAPVFMMGKSLDSAQDWFVLPGENDSTGSGRWGADNNMHLNTSAASSGSEHVQPALPTSTHVKLGNDDLVNKANDEFIMYAWIRVPGLVGYGTYEGNGSTDGPYIVINDGGSGFKAAWIMIKRITAVENWLIFNNKSDIDNPAEFYTMADANNVENDGTGGNDIDITANGFKCRTTNAATNSGTDTNNTYLYLAFAERPFGVLGLPQTRAR